MILQKCSLGKMVALFSMWTRQSGSKKIKKKKKHSLTKSKIKPGYC